jgi:ABC-2 type transport system permease protein
LRRESNLYAKQRDAIFKAYLDAQPVYAAALGRLDKIPYATKQIAIQLEMERRLLPRTSALESVRTDASRSAVLLRWLSPALELDAVLQAAAGTDAARHEAFLLRTRAYTNELRAFFWPRALKEAAYPSTPCERCAGRFNFTDHDKIPRFVADSPLDGIAMRTASSVRYLWLCAAAMVLLLWRTRNFRL